MINILSSKKNKTFSLKQFILRTQTIVVLAFILAYTVIVNYYFIAGLDESNYQDLQLEAQHFAMRYKENKTLLPPNSLHFTGFIDWRNVPIANQQHFPELEKATSIVNNNVVLTYKNNWLPSPKEVIYVVALPLVDNKMLFLFRHINREKYALSTNSKIFNLATLTLPIALFFFLLIHLAIKLTLKYNLKRLNHLARWVGQLNLDNVKEATPNFNFDELNLIADKQKQTLLQIKNLVENEQDFLRHASHELRTPIAVVRSNSELLSRILSPETCRQINIPASQNAVSRIARAAHNMQQLTETLLWLSREQEAELLNEAVSLKQTLVELIEDNNYLLNGKSVEVFTSLTDSELYIAATPCRLVLSNILRNAFQYTQQGAINITCHQHKVRIDNVNYHAEAEQKTNNTVVNNTANDYGYGLGLRLVEKIVTKLGWQYQNIAILDGRSVEIDFSQEK